MAPAKDSVEETGDLVMDMHSFNDNVDGKQPERQGSHVHMAHLDHYQFAALKSAERKLFWRVLLLNVALMFVNYLDRTNLSFASVQLNKDIGLSKEVYGLGAGLFFATYAGMQVPANLVLTKIGGPIWLGTIALCWGVVAACFALIRDVPSFLVLRCLLGFFEAGALPGMWAYLSHFYSKARITLPLGWLMGSLIVSQALGAPIAAGLMALDGLGGLQGWQWLFLIEGALAVIVAIAWFFMPRDIDAVRSLTSEEKAALHASLESHHKPVTSAMTALAGALRNPVVYVAGLGIKFFRDIAFYGLMYWLPLVIESLLGGGNTKEGKTHIYAILLTAVPFCLAAICQMLTSWHSQRRNERRAYLVGFWLTGVVSLALLPLPQMAGSSVGAFVLLSLGVMGVFGVEGISISFYLGLMGGEKGLGIAVINMLGSLGGFVGPYVIGALAQATHTYNSAMWLLAGCLAVASMNVVLTNETWAAKFSLQPSSQQLDSESALELPTKAPASASTGH